MTIGDIVSYISPELKLVSSGGVHRGRIVSFFKSRKFIKVLDIEIEPGEKKKYERYITSDQIIDIERNLK